MRGKAGSRREGYWFKTKDDALHFDHWMVSKPELSLCDRLQICFSVSQLFRPLKFEDMGRGLLDKEKLSRRRRGVSNEKEKLKVQDGYLNFLRRERIPVAVHFFTGMQLRGIVRGFDTYTFVLELEGTNKQILVFKHGVLYVDPMRPVGDVVGRLAVEAQQSEQTRQTQQSRQQQKRLRRPIHHEPAKAE